MMRKKQLCIGLALSATWLKGNGWLRKDSGIERLYMRDFYEELALQAERAKLDFVFRPDALALNMGRGGNMPGSGSLDPTILMASIAAATKHIGLVTTVSTTFNPPYVVARQLQSLHWTSSGRAGWNIVTALAGSENFSAEAMPAAEDRYVKAQEFLEVVNKLWSSFPYDAVHIDREAGQWNGYEMIKPIRHQGKFFNVAGPLNVPEHATGTPPLFQAGASDTGRDFAAYAADAIFASIPDKEAGIELRYDLRRRAQKHGRNPEAIRVLPGLYFFLGKKSEEAEELYREAHAHLTDERRLAALQSILGIDCSQMPLDQPVTPKLLQLLTDSQQAFRSRTHAELLYRLIAREQPTLKQLLARPEVIGSGHWTVVGTVEEVFTEIVEWYEAGAMDGIIALPGGSLQSLGLFCEELVPMLAEKGLFRKEYAGTTLREHLGMV